MGGEGARRLGWGALVLVWAVAAARIAFAPGHVVPGTLDEIARARLGDTARALEPARRAEAKRSFPGDLWSQEDDFHASERAWVLKVAAERGVHPAEVFRAIDEDLRASPMPPPGKATASPCKPRPDYD